MIRRYLVALLVVVLAILPVARAADIVQQAPITLDGQSFRRSSGKISSWDTLSYVNGAAFGMVCDSSTNNAVALQAAVDAAQLLSMAAGGGTLYLPAGICKVGSTINIANGGLIVVGTGQGIGATNGGTTIRDTRGSGHTFSVISQLPVVFRDLTVDSNNLARTSGSCFYFDGTGSNWNTRSRLENVGCRGAYDGVTAIITSDLAIEKSFFQDYQHNGITFTGNVAIEAGRYTVRDNYFINSSRKFTGQFGSNPFTTTNTSAVVSVHSVAHTLVTGMVAVFNGATLFNNVTLNGNYTVTVTGVDDFTVVANTTANANGAGGGTPFFWYGSNAAVEINGGNGTRITDNQMIENCWNVLVRPTNLGGGDVIIKGNTLDQYHCASIGYVQGASPQDTIGFEIVANKFTMLPGSGTAGSANQPSLGAIYLGTGTADTQPKWLSNGVIVGNIFRNAVSASVRMLDIEDGAGIVVGSNEFSNTNVSGMTGIKIGSAATNILFSGGDNFYNIPSGFWDPASVMTGALGQAITPPPAGRNLLDNGEFNISQRTAAVSGAITGATTGGSTALTYAADRWWIDTNVGSGAGKAQVKTTAPTPPTGFLNEMTLVKNSGNLTQPVCALQEIPTARAISAAGQSVILSVYMRGLSGVDAGNTGFTGYVITGTGTDEGMGTLTASAAVTPAWTGLASNAGFTVTITQTFARYASAPIAIGSTVKEIGVILCYNAGSGAGSSSDGVAVTGALLEVAGLQQNAPSAYEHRPVAEELLRCQRFYYEIAETNGPIFGNGMISATNVQTVGIPLPVTMRAVPAVAVTAGGFKYNIAGTLTAVGAGFAAGGTQSPSGISVVGALTAAVGQATQLVGSNTTGKITASADF